MNQQHLSQLGIEIGTYKTIVAMNKSSVQLFNGDREARSWMGMKQTGIRIFYQDQIFKKSMVMNLVNSPTLFNNQIQQLVNIGVFYGDCQIQDNQQTICLQDQKYNKNQLIIMFQQKIIQIVKDHIKEQIAQFNFIIPSFFSLQQKSMFLDCLLLFQQNHLQFSLISEQRALAQLYYDQFIKQKFSKESGYQQIQTVVFIDFGYSCSNLSIIQYKFNDRLCQTEIMYYESNQVGIKDLDKQFMTFLLKKCDGIDKSDQSIQNRVNDPIVQCKLLEHVEKIRKVLSTNNDIQVNIENIVVDQDIHFLLNRQVYQDQIQSVIQQYNEFIFQFFQKMTQLNIRVDRIEIIGGGARIPVLFDLVRMIASDENIVFKSFHSTEAIVLGSSIQINKNPMETQFSLNRKTVNDIVISVNGYNKQTLLQQNSYLPTTIQYELNFQEQNRLSLQIVYDNECIKDLSLINYNINDQVFNLNIYIDVDFNVMINTNDSNLQMNDNLLNGLDQQSLTTIFETEQLLQSTDNNYNIFCQKLNDLESMFYKLNQQIDDQVYSQNKCYFQYSQAQSLVFNLEQSLKQVQAQQVQKIFDIKSILETEQFFQNSFQEVEQMSNRQNVNSVRDINNVNKGMKVIKIDLYNQKVHKGGGFNKFIWPGGYEIAKALKSIKQIQGLTIEMDLRQNQLCESINEIINSLLNNWNLTRLLLKLDNLNIQQIDKLVFGLSRLPNLDHLILDLKLQQGDNSSIMNRIRNMMTNQKSNCLVEFI